MTILETDELLPKGQGTRFIPWDQFHFRDDGRTLEGMIVPYNQVAKVIDIDPETKQMQIYQEQFLTGSVAAMAQGFRARGMLDIPLVLDHYETEAINRIGFAVNLDSRSDGAWAAFRLYEDTNLIKIQSMLRESHKGLSVAFKDTKAPKLINGVISRVQVFIGHVAATPTPTYASAGITSMRSDDGQECPRPLLDEVRAWLAQERPIVQQEAI